MRNVEDEGYRLSVDEGGLDAEEGTVTASGLTERARHEFVAVYFVLMNDAVDFRWTLLGAGTWSGEEVVVDTFLSMDAMPDL